MSGESTRERRWFRDLLDFAFPPLCLGCGDFAENSELICEKCQDEIDTFSQPICLNCWQSILSGGECRACGEEGFTLFAYGDYTDPLKQAVIQYKFKGMTSAARVFAPALQETFGNTINSLAPDYLVPIPLHSSRQYARGYNQAEILADELAELLSIPVAIDIIYRTKRRTPQSRLSESERERNIRGVFSVPETAEPGQTLVLIDDVVTSGSTVREAKRALEEAGYKVPAVTSIAHGV